MEILYNNTLLLLFVVIALGYMVGRVKFFGIRLGTAAVLFVGLFIGAFDKALTLPVFSVELGLVLFVYTIGLSNGASFFSTLRQQGRQQISFILFFLTVPFLFIGGLFFWFEFGFAFERMAAAAGIFAGIGTNTAAFVSVLDIAGQGSREAAVIAVAYAVSYPVGVLGRILVFSIFQRLWKIDYTAEAEAWRKIYPGGQALINRAIKITQPAIVGLSLRDLQRLNPHWDVLFGRRWRSGEVKLVNGDTEFKLNDLIFVAGEVEKIARLAKDLGELTNDDVFADYSVYTKRRFFVSNPALVGQPIASLDLKERYGAQITRVRRGDSDVLPNRDTILELGDRVRLLFRRGDLPELIELFGDSYEAVSQVNLLSLGFGITLGLLLGMQTIPLPGNINFEIGFAAGTLIVALVLGAVRRTGAIVWTLPYSTNQTLQQLGLMLLLAWVGVSTGNTLGSEPLAGVENTILIYLQVSVLSLVLTTVSALVLGHKVLKMPFALVAGMLASQPAVFSFLNQEAKNHLPGIGFAMAIPIALILNVAYAQLLYVLLL